MRLLALAILLIATECNAQVQIFRAAKQRPSAAVDVTPRAPNIGTTPAADTSELKVIRGEVINRGSKRLKDREFYLCFYSASWCTFCHQFERTPEYTKIRAAYGVTTVDFDRAPREWRIGVSRLPTMQLRRISDRKLIRQWTGAVTLTQIDDARLVPPAKPIPVNNGVTQRDLIQIHDRLHNQASGLNTTWTWPGDIRTHLRTVHGVSL
jgi:hypothetical protein